MVNKTKEYANFIKATQKGYLYSQENKSVVVNILKQYITDYDKENIDLNKSIQATSAYFGDDELCGFMKIERINLFLKWLVDSNLENKIILDQTLFTNELMY